jgi:hypothetical protein
VYFTSAPFLGLLVPIGSLKRWSSVPFLDILGSCVSRSLVLSRTHRFTPVGALTLGVAGAPHAWLFLRHYFLSFGGGRPLHNVHFLIFLDAALDPPLESSDPVLPIWRVQNLLSSVHILWIPRSTLSLAWFPPVATSLRRFPPTKFLSCRATVARRVSSLPVAAKSFRVLSFLGRLLRRATRTRRVTSLTATIRLLWVVSANNIVYDPL